MPRSAEIYPSDLTSRICNITLQSPEHRSSAWAGTACVIRTADRARGFEGAIDGARWVSDERPLGPRSSRPNSGPANVRETPTKAYGSLKGSLSFFSLET